MNTTLPTLGWTGNPEADKLISTDPNALLIGFVLDQQITLQHAFTGPLTIQQRLGTINPQQLARMDVAKMENTFRKPPALHRYPASMAQRVQAMCSIIATEYNNNATAIWTTARTADELHARLRALPGIGPLKARTLMALLRKRFHVQLPGWEEYVPSWPTLADVTTVAEREDYQARKREMKKAAKAPVSAMHKPRR